MPNSFLNYCNKHIISVK